MTLPAGLETTSTVSPYFQAFLAAQIATGARGFCPKHHCRGDASAVRRHPPHRSRDYLQKNGYPDRGDYNQVGNYALTETSINISISNKPPSVYMAKSMNKPMAGH